MITIAMRNNLLDLMQMNFEIGLNGLWEENQFCNSPKYQNFFSCIVEQHQKVQWDCDGGIVQYGDPQVAISRVEIPLLILAEQLQSEGDNSKYWFEQDELQDHLFAPMQEYSGDN